MSTMRQFDGFTVSVLVWVTLLSFAPSQSLACPKGAVCCNNVEACDLPVDEVLFGMVHNAMASPSAGFVFFGNHLNDPIVESLDSGTSLCIPVKHDVTERGAQGNVFSDAACCFSWQNEKKAIEGYPWICATAMENSCFVTEEPKPVVASVNETPLIRLLRSTTG